MAVINIPGVPPLLKQATNLANTALLLKSDASIVIRGFQRPRWGIYKAGALVLQADSVVSLDYRRESRISTHPIEAGQFAAYDKVQMPYDVRITLVKSGSDADRGTFLTALESVVESLDLYDIVSPEKTYTSANIERFDYSRKSSSGVGMLTVDLFLTQVRTTAISTKTNAARPSGADSVSGGMVQSFPVRSPEIIGKALLALK